MKMNKLYGFLLLALPVSSIIICMQKKHEAHVDSVVIDCPFEYKEGLSDEEKSLLTHIFERGQTVIDTSKKELAHIAPAHPCIAAFAKRPRAVTQKEGKKDLMWAGHLHFSNKVSEVPKEIEKALAIGAKDSKADLMVSLFSRDMGADFLSDGWDLKHGGNSQEQHMLFVQNAITNHFGIADRQVQRYLFKSNRQYRENKHLLIDKSVFVDGSESDGVIKLYSISPIHEGILAGGLRLQECSFDFTKGAYGRIWMSPFITGTIWHYNSVLLSYVPKYNVASLNAKALSNINPYNAVYSPQAPLNRTLILAPSILKGMAGGLAIVAAGVAVSKVAGRFSPYVLKYT